MARTNVGKRDKGTQTRVPGGGHTHVDHIRDVVDVILGHHRIGRCQVQQVVVPGLCALQLVLRVLGLSLWGRGGGGADAAEEVWKIRDGRADLWEPALERTPPAISTRTPPFSCHSGSCSLPGLWLCHRGLQRSALPGILNRS